MVGEQFSRHTEHEKPKSWLRLASGGIVFLLFILSVYLWLYL